LGSGYDSGQATPFPVSPAPPAATPRSSTSIHSRRPPPPSTSPYPFTRVVAAQAPGFGRVWSSLAGYLCGGADTQTGKVSDKIIQVVP